MQDLIKRIEAANGPSRELDAEIWEYLGLAPEYDNSKKNYGCWHYEGEGRYHFADDSSWGKNQYAPHYTSSIDAAMTLVPEEWEWSLSYDGSRYVTEVWVDNSRYWCEAATPALALCAAALRAVMAKNEG